MCTILNKSDDDDEFSRCMNLANIACIYINALSWWIDHADIYLSLSLLAKRLLCGQSTLIPAEQLFSAAIIY